MSARMAHNRFTASSAGGAGATAAKIVARGSVAMPEDANVRVAGRNSAAVSLLAEGVRRSQPIGESS